MDSTVAISELMRDLTETWAHSTLDYPDGTHQRPTPGLTPVDALPLGDDACLAILGDGRGSYWCAPLSRGAQGWRLAAGTDGVASQLLRELARGSRIVGRFTVHCHQGEWLTPSTSPDRYVPGDQTHLSVVVGDATIVKWFGRPGEPGILTRRLNHLIEAGFKDIPKLFGEVHWSPPSGADVLVATASEYVQDAEDGWTWSVNAFRAHMDHGEEHCPGGSCLAWFASDLGALTARLHIAAATPTAVLPHPVDWVGPAEIQRWVGRVRARIWEARAAFASDLGDVLLGTEIADDLAALVDAERAATTVVHGDLHVGQILRSPVDGTLAVVDLDGDPLDAHLALFESPMRDVAHLATSIALVGQVVQSRTQVADAPVEDWAVTSTLSFTTAYSDLMEEAGFGDLVDLRLLRAMLVERLASELVYATRYLPRWAYAPIGLARSHWLARTLTGLT